MSSGPVIVTVSTVSSFERTWTDEGSGADMDVSLWRPQVDKKSHFFLLGDFAIGNYSNPTGSVMVINVQNDDPENPALKKPKKFNKVWDDKGSGADKNGSIWAAEPPPGYVAIGMVSNRGYQEPVIENYRCLRSDLAKPAQFGSMIWWDKGSSADEDVEIYSIAGTGLFYAQADYNDPTGPIWVPQVFDQTGP